VWLELKLNSSPLPYGEEKSSMYLKNMIKTVKTKAGIVKSWGWLSGRKTAVPPFFLESPKLYLYRERGSGKERGRQRG
jgi:hypothetical protein